ncbi:hypothetical protein Y032_0029g1904 [Ancylostoma ceylanicum]|nr:hypothetical protein Y032_0029g1904 [Ancylostoma ceylanicum]
MIESDCKYSQLQKYADKSVGAFHTLQGMLITVATPAAATSTRRVRALLGVISPAPRGCCGRGSSSRD